MGEVSRTGTGGLPAEPARGGIGIRIVGLTKGFGSVQVLRDLTLEVRAGETFVIIGASGCGKTVLLKHLLGLLRPDAGQILIDGAPLASPGEAKRYRIGMVFQSAALFSSLTVGENVGLWLKEHRVASDGAIERIVTEKLALVGLADKKHLMPSELSGGMRKRVAIARALATDPDLMLYDEPTAELDPVMTDHIAEEIVDLKERFRITSVVVTHDLNMGCYVADRMGMMHEGRLVEVGTPEQIRRSANPVVRAFITTQTKGMGGT